MRTFADLPLGAIFYTAVGGEDRVECQKVAEDKMKMKTLQDKWVVVKASPLWEVQTITDLWKAAESRNRSFYTPVANHSTSWPYGEH